MRATPIRVLIVDDSITVREYLAYLLGEDPALQVVGSAGDGLEALEQAVHLRPDIIVMDVHMPRLGGFEATRQIMQRVPTPIVMISTAARHDEVAMTFDAIRAGALTVLEKPVGLDHPDHADMACRLVDTVKLMAQVKVVRRWPAHTPMSAAASAVERGRRIRVVAIGASTGGPQVLAELLGAQPRNFPAPIVIVQHITPGFTAGLVQWLGQGTKLAVKLAEATERMLPGTAYLAPDGVQMGVTRDGCIVLSGESGEDGFRPSASHLFASVAEAYGRSAIGILLTGMGRDGATGLRKLRDAGGLTIAQDKASSVVFGMPAEAIRLGAAQHVLPPEEVVAMLRSLAAAG
jgi:two-component system, chemotaxis family, protein-glutamate methylesterase/glutaminase